MADKRKQQPTRPTLYRTDRAAHDQIVPYVMRSLGVANLAVKIAKRLRGAR